MSKKELLKPKIDVVFHSLFKKGNEGITKAMIEAITKEKIENIDLDQDRNLIGRYPEEKIGVVDLRVTLDNGTICDIEVQIADNKDTAERFLYYWSKIYSSQLLKGDYYKELNKVIGIIIIDYELEKTKGIEQLSTEWKIKEVTTGKDLELTDALELCIIEIPKAREVLKKEPNNKLAQWIMFMNDPNEKEVSEIMEKNEEIKEAMEELEEISNDRRLRIIAELKEKAIKDENNGRIRYREEGLKERKKITDYKSGKQEEKIEIARELIKIGMKIEQISEVTKLSIEEIEKIKEECKI